MLDDTVFSEINKLNSTTYFVKDAAATVTYTYDKRGYAKNIKFKHQIIYSWNEIEIKMHY